MTDKEKVVTLFKELGIGSYTEPELNEVILTAGDDKIVGYTEYYAEFNFDDDGKFVNIGIWE